MTHGYHGHPEMNMETWEDNRGMAMQNTQENLTPDGRSGKTGRIQLDYPWQEEEAPAPGKVLEVSDGVFWVRMPLPISLEWINLWLLRDVDGWVVVDTGMATEAAAEHWRTIFKTCLDGLPVKRVIVTHMHPDHVGLAGWMTRKFQCMLHMSQLEYIMCRMLVADTGRDAPEEGVRFYRETGWNDDSLDRYKVRFGGFGRAVSRLPDSYIRLSEGDELNINNSVWKVMVGSGHSPEHVCLYNHDRNILISGDQLLPRISSNVSVHPTEPDADPLSDWLSSCQRLRADLPSDVLVLPAHNIPFRGAHDRLDALMRGHDVLLQRLMTRLSTPKTVLELFTAMFGRQIDDDSLSLATGETLAHLNCLIHRGLVRRDLREDGIALYQAN